MPEYQDYPKVMRHPNHRAATLILEKNEPGTPAVLKPGGSGTPEVLPDVTVNNEDEEQMYASRGYVPAGVSDPKAYMAALLGVPIADEGFQEFPKWKYHDEKEACIVEHRDAELELGDGWFDDPGLTKPTVFPASQVAPQAEKPATATRKYAERVRAAS